MQSWVHRAFLDVEPDDSVVDAVRARENDPPATREMRRRSRSMRERVELHAFAVRQNQCDPRASQSHTRLLVDEYDGPRHLFHILRRQDTSRVLKNWLRVGL